MEVKIFRVVTPCRTVNSFRRFGRSQAVQELSGGLLRAGETKILTLFCVSARLSVERCILKQPVIAVCGCLELRVNVKLTLEQATKVQSGRDV
jgi:hypothetical protein